MSTRKPTARRSPPRIPNQSIPRLPSIPRNPPGYGVSEINLTARGLEGTEPFKDIKPAGEPPREWPGSEPEWAVKFGLDRNGLVQDVDYFYQGNVMGTGGGYYSQVDFLVPRFHIAIEVQGEFWHYGQGHEKIQQDELRRTLIESKEFSLIFIDEDDAIRRPTFLVEQALRGIDHSKLGKSRRG